MHLGGLDLNLLIALDALLSEKNVTRAAERLNISQPGMSAALHKLREYFGDPLLERIGRRLELTPRAHTLADPVKTIIFDIRALDTHGAQFDPATAQRVFRVAASTFCSDLLAVPVIRRLAEMAPEVACHFDDLQSETLGRLEGGQLDLAITIPQRLFADAMELDRNLSEVPLFADRMVLAVAKDNAAVADTIGFDALCEQPYAETRFGNDLIGIGERVWRQQPNAPRIRAWLPNFHLTLDAVSRTDLVAMVPSRLVAAYHGRYEVRTLPVPFDVPMLDERLFWHPRNDADRGHTWFRELLGTIAVEQGLVEAV